MIKMVIDSAETNYSWLTVQSLPDPEFIQLFITTDNKQERIIIEKAELQASLGILDGAKLTLADKIAVFAKRCLPKKLRGS